MASNASSSEEESEDEAEEESEEEIPIPRPRKTAKTPKAAKSAKATPAKKGPTAVKPASVKPERPDDENDYVIGDNDDPYSLFFDNIVLLTDSDGDPISGPFLQLPSKKQYPDYYEDITQPIALDKIRQKVIKGRYKNLEQMEDDIVLMCNNAREYNMEGSQIFMDATQMMRVARTKRIEIEAQFGDQMSEGSASPKPSPKKKEPKKKGRKSHNSAQDNNEERAKGNRLQRSVYNALFSQKDPTGRQVCALFMVKPDPEIYPDYYQIIKEPMDMGSIDKKISSGQYSSLEELMQDISLMCKNAKQYNEPNSQVFIDANILEQVATNKVKEICQKKNIPVTPEKVGKAETMTQPGWRAGPKTKYDFILHRVNKQEDGMGRNLAMMFQSLPSKIELPDYYRVVKRPMDLDKIQARVKKIPEENGYKNIEEFMEELLLVFENATIYNEPGSTIYQDALILHKVAIDCLHMIENGTREDPNPVFKIQDPQSFLQQMMRDLQKHMLSNSNFQKIEEVLADFIPVERNRPRKLGDIGVWLDAKRYRRLDVYQGHVFSLFEAIRERCEPGDEIWKLSLELHKQFIEKRDVLTKSGQLYSSPACAYGLGDIEDSLEDLKKRREEGDFSPQNGETWDVDAMSNMFQVETEDIETEINLGNDGCTYFLQYHMPHPQQNMPPILYKIDDCVYLSVNDTRGPRIARIVKIWKDHQNNVMCKAIMYHRPEECQHEPVRNFHFKELIMTGTEHIIPMHTIRGKCCVLVKPDFQTMRPVNIQENHVYFHEANYKEFIENGQPKLMLKKIRSFKRYSPSNRVVDDEYFYFTDKPIPLLPTPSPRLDQMVKAEIRKRTFEAQQNGAATPAQHQQPQHHPHQGFPPRPGFAPQMHARPPMHPGSPYHHPGSPVPPPGFMHRMPMPHLQRPPMSHSPHPFANSPGPSYPAISSPVPIQRAPFTPQMQQTQSSRTETPKTGKRTKGSTKGSGLSQTGYTLFTAAVNKQVREENPQSGFGDLSKIIGERWRALSAEEKKEYEDKAKAKVAEAQKRLDQQKVEDKRRREMEMLESDSVGEDSNHSQAFQPQSPGQANGHPPPATPQQYVAANPIAQAQTVAQTHTVTRIAQSPMKPHTNVRQGEIQSRAIGPLVTNPPKPTRVLHSDAYMKYMEGLDGGKPPASKWDKMIASVHPQRAETMNLPTHWLRNQGNHRSLKQALVHLKDVLLRDAVNPQSNTEC
ncbi:Oidioi.mRNA.OKI2018_I69.chr1.g1670.t1.cds [Oikopleura dioica]|uniref:Oidioi.mRNA.OKI2018_I69.chr1.g1670.t1.cds n=1 Tax=Oikopleura dioica TaxID=34765 RepID=A0ABN7SNM5_OIKDI|nr:Oidioi.mRNA.OKI2018_I69.chr1.g1670.t1.cds [Oikopleura dioica]